MGHGTWDMGHGTWDIGHRHQARQACHSLGELVAKNLTYIVSTQLVCLEAGEEFQVEFFLCQLSVQVFGVVLGNSC